ncbi:MAG: hypothetical protein LBV67_10025, partial [Streptococcaceae bacterium]|nr:hypothetical protein [Streptococcaceae bacterium]
MMLKKFFSFLSKLNKHSRLFSLSKNWKTKLITLLSLLTMGFGQYATSIVIISYSIYEYFASQEVHVDSIVAASWSQDGLKEHSRFVYSFIEPGNMLTPSNPGYHRFVTVTHIMNTAKLDLGEKIEYSSKLIVENQVALVDEETYFYPPGEEIVEAGDSTPGCFGPVSQVSFFNIHFDGEDFHVLGYFPHEATKVVIYRENVNELNAISLNVQENNAQITKSTGYGGTFNVSIPESELSGFGRLYIQAYQEVDSLEVELGTNASYDFSTSVSSNASLFATERDVLDHAGNPEPLNKPSLIGGGSNGIVYLNESHAQKVIVVKEVYDLSAVANSVEAIMNLHIENVFDYRFELCESRDTLKDGALNVGEITSFKEVTDEENNTIQVPNTWSGMANYYYNPATGLVENPGRDQYVEDAITSASLYDVYEDTNGDDKPDAMVNYGDNEWYRQNLWDSNRENYDKKSGDTLAKPTFTTPTQWRSAIFPDVTNDTPFPQDFLESVAIYRALTSDIYKHRKLTADGKYTFSKSVAGTNVFQEAGIATATFERDGMVGPPSQNAHGTYPRSTKISPNENYEKVTNYDWNQYGPKAPVSKLLVHSAEVKGDKILVRGFVPSNTKVLEVNGINYIEEEEEEGKSRLTFNQLGGVFDLLVDKLDEHGEEINQIHLKAWSNEEKTTSLADGLATFTVVKADWEERKNLVEANYIQLDQEELKIQSIETSTDHTTFDITITLPTGAVKVDLVNELNEIIATFDEQNPTVQLSLEDELITSLSLYVRAYANEERTIKVEKNDIAIHFEERNARSQYEEFLAYAIMVAEYADEQGVDNISVQTGLGVVPLSEYLLENPTYALMNHPATTPKFEEENLASTPIDEKLTMLGSFNYAGENEEKWSIYANDGAKQKELLKLIAKDPSIFLLKDANGKLRNIYTYPHPNDTSVNTVYQMRKDNLRHIELAQLLIEFRKYHSINLANTTDGRTKYQPVENRQNTMTHYADGTKAIGESYSKANGFEEYAIGEIKNNVFDRAQPANGPYKTGDIMTKGVVSIQDTTTMSPSNLSHLLLDNVKIDNATLMGNTVVNYTHITDKNNSATQTVGVGDGILVHMDVYLSQLRKNQNPENDDIEPNIFSIGKVDKDDLFQTNTTYPSSGETLYVSLKSFNLKGDTPELNITFTSLSGDILGTSVVDGSQAVIGRYYREGEALYIQFNEKINIRLEKEITQDEEIIHYQGEPLYQAFNFSVEAKWDKLAFSNEIAIDRNGREGYVYHAKSNAWTFVDENEQDEYDYLPYYPLAAQVLTPNITLSSVDFRISSQLTPMYEAPNAPSTYGGEYIDYSVEFNKHENRGGYPLRGVAYQPELVIEDDNILGDRYHEYELDSISVQIGEKENLKWAYLRVLDGWSQNTGNVEENNFDSLWDTLDFYDGGNTNGKQYVSIGSVEKPIRWRDQELLPYVDETDKIYDSPRKLKADGKEVKYNPIRELDYVVIPRKLEENGYTYTTFTVAINPYMDGLVEEVIKGVFISYQARIKQKAPEKKLANFGIENWKPNFEATSAAHFLTAIPHAKLPNAGSDVGYTPTFQGYLGFHKDLGILVARNFGNYNDDENANDYNKNASVYTRPQSYDVVDGQHYGIGFISTTNGVDGVVKDLNEYISLNVRDYSLNQHKPDIESTITINQEGFYLDGNKGNLSGIDGLLLGYIIPNITIVNDHEEFSAIGGIDYTLKFKLGKEELHHVQVARLFGEHWVEITDSSKTIYTVEQLDDLHGENWELDEHEYLITPIANPMIVLKQGQILEEKLILTVNLTLNDSLKKISANPDEEGAYHYSFYDLKTGGYKDFDYYKYQISVWCWGYLYQSRLRTHSALSIRSDIVDQESDLENGEQLITKTFQVSGLDNNMDLQYQLPIGLAFHSQLPAIEKYINEYNAKEENAKKKIIKDTLLNVANSQTSTPDDERFAGLSAYLVEEIIRNDIIIIAKKADSSVLFQFGGSTPITEDSFNKMVGKPQGTHAPPWVYVAQYGLPQDGIDSITPAPSPYAKAVLNAYLTATLHGVIPTGGVKGGQTYGDLLLRAANMVGGTRLISESDDAIYMSLLHDMKTLSPLNFAGTGGDMFAPFRLAAVDDTQTIEVGAEGDIYPEVQGNEDWYTLQAFGGFKLMFGPNFYASFTEVMQNFLSLESQNDADFRYLDVSVRTRPVYNEELYRGLLPHVQEHFLDTQNLNDLGLKAYSGNTYFDRYSDLRFTDDLPSLFGWHVMNPLADIEQHDIYGANDYINGRVWNEIVDGGPARDVIQFQTHTLALLSASGDFLAAGEQMQSAASIEEGMQSMAPATQNMTMPFEEQEIVDWTIDRVINPIPVAIEYGLGYMSYEWNRENTMSGISDMNNRKMQWSLIVNGGNEELSSITITNELTKAYQNNHHVAVGNAFPAKIFEETSNPYFLKGINDIKIYKMETTTQPNKEGFTPETDIYYDGYQGQQAFKQGADITNILLPLSNRWQETAGGSNDANPKVIPATNGKNETMELVLNFKARMGTTINYPIMIVWSSADTQAFEWYENDVRIAHTYYNGMKKDEASKSGNGKNKLMYANTTLKRYNEINWSQMPSMSNDGYFGGIDARSLAPDVNGVPTKGNWQTRNNNATGSEIPDEKGRTGGRPLFDTKLKTLVVGQDSGQTKTAKNPNQNVLVDYEDTRVKNPYVAGSPASDHTMENRTANAASEGFTLKDNNNMDRRFIYYSALINGKQHKYTANARFSADLGNIALYQSGQSNGTPLGNYRGDLLSVGTDTAPTGGISTTNGVLSGNIPARNRSGVSGVKLGLAKDDNYKDMINIYTVELDYYLDPKTGLTHAYWKKNEHSLEYGIDFIIQQNMNQSDMNGFDVIFLGDLAALDVPLYVEYMVEEMRQQPQGTPYKNTIKLEGFGGPKQEVASVLYRPSVDTTGDNGTTNEPYTSRYGTNGDLYSAGGSSEANATHKDGKFKWGTTVGNHISNQTQAQRRSNLYWGIGGYEGELFVYGTISSFSLWTWEFTGSAIGGPNIGNTDSKAGVILNNYHLEYRLWEGKRIRAGDIDSYTYDLYAKNRTGLTTLTHDDIIYTMGDRIVGTFIHGEAQKFTGRLDNPTATYGNADKSTSLSGLPDGVYFLEMTKSVPGFTAGIDTKASSSMVVIDRRLHGSTNINGGGGGVKNANMIMHYTTNHNQDIFYNYWKPADAGFTGFTVPQTGLITLGNRRLESV